MPVALRIINDIAYASRLNHDIVFAGRAQCLGG